MIFALTQGDGIQQVELVVEGSTYTMRPDGEESLVVDARPVGPGCWSMLVGSRSYTVRVQQDRSIYTVEMGARTWSFDLRDPARALSASRTASGHGAGLVKAPMPGRIIRVLVELGQSVKIGQGVLVVEAMKMENELQAPRDGVVSEVHVSEGQVVESQDSLLLIGDSQSS
jgi:biotin carboxyl carrier protein